MQINSKIPKIDNCLYRVSVKAIIIKQDKVLLVKEWDDEWWSFPGGGIEYGENVRDTLYREMYEELGVEKQDISSDWQILHIGIGAVVEGLPMVNLFVRIDIDSNNIVPTDEIVECKWFDTDELGDLLIVPTTLDTNSLKNTIREQANLDFTN